MRVLLIVHGYPPTASGGTELYVAALARTLTTQGEQVTVLAREADPSRAEYAVRRVAIDGITVCLINNTFARCSSFAESYDNPAITAAVAELLDELAPDLAHIHHLTCLSTGLVTELAGRNIPTLMTLHDYWLGCHRGQLLDSALQPCAGPGAPCAGCGDVAAGVGGAGFLATRAVRRIGRLSPGAERRLRRVGAALLRRATTGAAVATMAQRTRHMRTTASRISAFLAPSRSILEWFVAWGIPRARIELTSLGSDLIPSAAIPRAPGAPLRLGFMGGLTPAKGPHLLLEAFAALPAGSATLDILGEVIPYHGDDSYRTRLQPYRTLPGVRWRGAVPHADVPGALAALDALIVPSIWPENSPCVIREAFLAGVPVVATAVGGIPEMIRDGVDGLLVLPGEAGAVTKALRRLAGEPGLLEKLRRGIAPVRSVAADAAELGNRYRAILAARARPRLAAVVLNHRTPHDAMLAVRSLQSSGRRADDVLVVDNASGDASRELLPRLLRGVEVLWCDENRGFSAGCNLGIRAALDRGADLVLLLNADAIVDSDCLGRLEAALLARPEAGLAGPLLLSRGDPSRIASAGIRFSPATGRMRQLGAGEKWCDETDAVREVAAVSGCAMLIRREVLETAGWLDEDFFFAFEDVELCLRASRWGWSSLLVGDALVYHSEGASIGPTSPRRLYFASRNHLLAAQRAAPTGRGLGLARACLIVGYNLGHALLGRGGLRLAGAAAVLRGVKDHVRRRHGAGSFPAEH